MYNTMFRTDHRGRRLLYTGLMALALLLLFGQPGTMSLAQETGEKAEEEEAPKKFTNDDLKRWKRTAPAEREPAGGNDQTVDDPGQGDPGAEGAESEAEVAVETVDAWDSVGVVTDSQGRGEDWWRKTMSEARAAVTGAQRQRDALQSEMNRRQADFSAMDDPAARDLVNERIQELFTLLDEADQAIADAEQALSDLEDDARRSGALPGWLR